MKMNTTPQISPSSLRSQLQRVYSYELTKPKTFLPAPKIKELEAITDDTGRVYICGEQRLPSITTILSYNKKHIMQSWAELVGRDYANDVKVLAGLRGTQLHNWVEQLYCNNKIETTNINMWRYIKPILGVLEDDIDNILYQETSLYSTNLGIAGRLDLCADYKGKRCIIDFKTTDEIRDLEFYKSYCMQVLAYSLMLEERTSIKVTNAVIIFGTGASQKFIIELDDLLYYYDDLLVSIEHYKNKTYG